MKVYWVSWYHTSEFSEFELHSPWWITGSRDHDDAETVCAAIRSVSIKQAKEQIYKAYDSPPRLIEFRFVEKMRSDFSPFNDRFQKQSWMIW